MSPAPSMYLSLSLRAWDCVASARRGLPFGRKNYLLTSLRPLLLLLHLSGKMRSQLSTCASPPGVAYRPSTPSAAQAVDPSHGDTPSPAREPTREKKPPRYFARPCPPCSSSLPSPGTLFPCFLFPVHTRPAEPGGAVVVGCISAHVLYCKCG